MSSVTDKVISSFARTDAPRRETLRVELARERAREQGPIEKPRLVLASASPRRLMLLSQAGIEPDALRPASIDETPKPREMPRALATRLARSKAETARDQIANDTDIASAYVLAADTVVATGRRVFGKPEHMEQAVATLERLSGRSHHVLTGVCLITPDDRVRTRIVVTKVRFRHLTRDDVEAYIASREWRGKAGAYAIQGLAGCFVRWVNGSYTNVVGLPLTEVTNMLIAEGFPVHFSWLRAGEDEID